MKNLKRIDLENKLIEMQWNVTHETLKRKNAEKVNSWEIKECYNFVINYISLPERVFQILFTAELKKFSQTYTMSLKAEKQLKRLKNSRKIAKFYKFMADFSWR